MHACTYVCVYACIHACMHARMYVCMYVCVYVCVYVCSHQLIQVFASTAQAAGRAVCTEKQVSCAFPLVSHANLNN
jgi:hypothetical protein